MSCARVNNFGEQRFVGAGEAGVDGTGAAENRGPDTHAVEVAEDIAQIVRAGESDDEAGVGTDGWDSRPYRCESYLLDEDGFARLGDRGLGIGLTRGGGAGADVGEAERIAGEVKGGVHD